MSLGRGSDLLVSALVMAMSGGLHRARLVGRGSCSPSVLWVSIQSCCSASRKASGGSWRFRQESLRTLKGSISGVGPTVLSGSGEGDNREGHGEPGESSGTCSQQQRDGDKGIYIEPLLIQQSRHTYLEQISTNVNSDLEGKIHNVDQTWVK